MIFFFQANLKAKKVAANPTNKDTPIYENAKKYWLSRISDIVSSENDENVVKPPQKPANISNCILVVIKSDFVLIPNKYPIIKLPKIFTKKVPKGNGIVVNFITDC